MQQPCTSLHPAAVALFLCTKLHNALDCLGLKFAIHLHPSLSLLHLTLHYTGPTEVTVQAMNCIATLHLTSLKLQSTASCSEFDILTALNYVQCSLLFIVLHCTKHRTMHRTALLAAVNLISEHFPVMVTVQLSPTPAAADDDDDTDYHDGDDDGHGHGHGHGHWWSVVTHSCCWCKSNIFRTLI